MPDGLDPTLRPPHWYWGPKSARPRALIDQHHRLLANPEGRIFGMPGKLNTGISFAKTAIAERADTRDF